MGIVASWSSIIPSSAPVFSTLEDWWNKNIEAFDSSGQRHFGKVLIYVLWHVWKERSRRFFENVSLQVLDVPYLVREGLVQLGLARQTACNS